MTRDDFRRQADLVRAIPLEVVLTSWDAVRDQQDKSRWHTERGPLSVTGTKFFNWHARHGGGGAIDLVMHLGGWDARQAIGWLGHHLGCHVAGPHPTTNSRVDTDPACSTGSTCRFTSSSTRSESLGAENEGVPTRHRRHQQLHLPAASLANLPRVRRYLTEQRGLSATILDVVDRRGQVVRGRPRQRGLPHGHGETQSSDWRRTARHGPPPLARSRAGTRKNAGYFWVGNRGAKQIVLCESAIDAISYFQLGTRLHDATSSGVHLYLDGGSSPRCDLASSAAGTRLRHLLRLRCRRAR